MRTCAGSIDYVKNNLVRADAVRNGRLWFRTRGRLTDKFTVVVRGVRFCGVRPCHLGAEGLRSLAVRSDTLHVGPRREPKEARYGFLQVLARSEDAEMSRCVPVIESDGPKRQT